MKRFILTFMLVPLWQALLAQCAAPVITASGPTSFCPGGSVTLNAPSGNTWAQKADFGGTARYAAASFSIGSKGYMGTGDDGSRKKDFWEYDPATGAWTQKADFGGTARYLALGFSIGSKGYIGTGNDGSRKKDFWEYDPTSNTWTQKADFGGVARHGATGFSIGSKGYIGTGTDGGYIKDFWEYNPTSNAWTQKADFGGTGRAGATGFSIGSKGYIGTGLDGFNKKDFWEYDPASNTWTQKADFGGTARLAAMGFSFSSKGYIGTGHDGSSKKDFWEYNPISNAWTQKADFGGAARFYATSFSIGSKGYISTGTDGSNKKDFWEYDPGYSYAWQPGGQTTASITVSTAGNYTVIATNALSCSAISAATVVTVNTPVTPVITASGPTSFCPGGNVTLSAPTGNTWAQKADFGGVARYYATGFSIGSKGYIGTGNDGSSNKKDFWEYDPATGAWTQKADFGGTARYAATGFSIGNKGYIGIGLDASSYKKDFWEYDPTSNAWTQKADFAGLARYAATGFSIGNKGYIGTGYDGSSYYKDFWEYNPTGNAWTQKADFGGTARQLATGFSIGSKGYIGTGNDGSIKKDFWEYDPTGNAWTQKADFAGLARYQATGFSIGNKGYIGIGYDGSIKKDFWEYNPTGNAWTQKADFGGTARRWATGFSIGSKGYIGTGYDGSIKNDFWEYDPGYSYAWQPGGQTTASITVSTAGNYTVTTTNALGCSATSAATIVTVNTPVTPVITASGPISFCPGGSVTLSAPAGNAWMQKADFGGVAREGATGFSIGSKGYIGTGEDGSYKKDFWEYDPATGAWTQKADFGGSARYQATGFSIGSKGYIGTGFDGGVKNDFWEYDPASNAWTQKADFGGSARVSPTGFSIGSKGYIGTGSDGNYKKDFWEYDPASNVWTQKADFGGVARVYATGFSIGSKGYIGTGTDNNSKKDFWEYDPTNNAWTQKADFGGTARQFATGFSIGNKGYIGTGADNVIGFTKDLWEYNPTSNAWTQKADFGGVARYYATGFSIGSKGFIGTGTGMGGSRKKDFWEYDPGYSYAWQPGGQTTASITVSTAGNYTVTTTNALGCSAISAATVVTINTPSIPVITASGPTTFCPGGSVTLSATASATWTQKADFGGTARVAATSFSIGNKGYIGTGFDNSSKKDFWEYDPATNAWTQKADFGGTARVDATGFSIGSKGYIGTGFDGTAVTIRKDFWEYDPASNAWVQKADFGGMARRSAIGFSIGNKGYIGTGGGGGVRKDFWEYNPATDAWVQKADFGGTARADATGFSIGSKGYIGTGFDGTAVTIRKDFWEYNPATDTWVQKADFGGTAREYVAGFSIGSKGYIGLGIDPGGNYKQDFWEYNPATDAWVQKADFGGTARQSATGFSIGSKGYIGTGDGGGLKKDFWEYDPGSYVWQPGGQTTESITVSTAGNYTVTTTNTLGCTATSAVIVVTVNTPATPTVGVTQPSCTVATGTITVTNPTGTGITYSINGSLYQSGTTFSNVLPGSYSVTAKNSGGCVSAATPVTINAQPATPAAPTVSVTQPTCSTPTGTITISNPIGAGITYSIDGSVYQLGTTFSNVTPGSYNVTARNSNGCISISTTAIVNAVPPSPPAPTISIIQPTCSTPTGNITINIPTGGGITYSINGTTYQVSNIFSNVAPGNYNVTAKNGSCVSAAATAVINATPADNQPPSIPSQFTVFLNASGQASLTPASVAPLITDNCAVNPNSIIVRANNFTCANINTSGPHQAYVANTSTGNQPFRGEIGMDFTVNNPNGIQINQLGAFDHQANGITGTQSGGVRVAIFNKATQAIVTGLNVVISGSTDPLVINYRMRNIPPVTLMPGNYVIVAKGYNAAELNGNVSFGGGPFAVGDNGSGAITYTNRISWGNDNPAASFSYPPFSTTASTNEYLAGSFNYAIGSAGTANTITVSASDMSGNNTMVNAIVTVVDTFYTIVTRNITVNLDASGHATIQPSDVLLSLKNNCGATIISSTLQVSPSSFNCSNVSNSTAIDHQAYTSNTATGNQAYLGEIGMDFTVNNANGIQVNQLGAFDHQSNGITGTQSGGVRVAIFNKATQTIVPGLDIVIVGNADGLLSNHRMKNITPVTLLPGNYVIVVKGYNNTELNGNAGISGGPFAAGDNAAGAITYTNRISWGANTSFPSFSYPANSQAGSTNEYHAGTFSYTTTPVPGTRVVLKATDVYGNVDSMSAMVTVEDPNHSCPSAPVIAGSISPAKPATALMEVPKLSVYPNPSNGAFNVVLSYFSGAKMSIEITDGNGKLVAVKSLTLSSKTPVLTVSFDLGSAASGMYVLRAVSVSGVQTAKLIIQR